MFNYLPNKKSDWKLVLEKHKKEYEKYIEELITVKNNYEEIEMEK
jgi:hypothetical protein